MIVLDASALLARLFREPGHAMVALRMEERACMSTVNLSEVVNRFVRDGHRADQVLWRLTRTPLEIVPFSAINAAQAASLYPKTKPLGLSLADRACLALAMMRGLPVLTADRVWKQLDIGVTIEVIR